MEKAENKDEDIAPKYKESIYINARRSRDGSRLFGCLFVRVEVGVCVCHILASFSSLCAAVTLCT